MWRSIVPSTHVKQSLEHKAGTVDPEPPVFRRNIVQDIEDKLDDHKREQGHRRDVVGGKLWVQFGVR